MKLIVSYLVILFGSTMCWAQGVNDIYFYCGLCIIVIFIGVKYEVSKFLRKFEAEANTLQLAEMERLSMNIEELVRTMCNEEGQRIRPEMFVIELEAEENDAVTETEMELDETIFETGCEAVAGGYGSEIFEVVEVKGGVDKIEQ